MDLGAIKAASTDTVEFDLLKNPFVVLRIPLSAPKEEIAEAFDEAMADGHSSDDALRDARRQLLAPKLRLAATVDLLADAGAQQRDLAISSLQHSMPLSDLIALAKDLPMASRAGFLSNIAQLRPSSGMLRYFALTLASIDRPQLETTIAAIFEEAGLPRPSGESIQEAFDTSTTRNIKRPFSAYVDAKSASADMRRCLDEGMASASTDQLAAYTAVVAAYQDFASAPIGELRRRVDGAVNRFLADTKDEAALEEIEFSLGAWDELSQPAQLLAQNKGRDEPQARELFQQLRGFMIELANEKDAPAAALRISKVCTEVFAELPRAVSQLKDDLSALQNLVDQEGARDLVHFVEAMRKDLDPLVADLKRSGFAANSIGHARRAFQLFEHSILATRDTAAAEIPWGLVRMLALDINNELGEGAACEKLIAGLMAHSGFAHVPEKMQASIRTDMQVLRSNVAQARFQRAIDKKDAAGARQALVDLAGLATDESERKQYQQAIANVDAAKRGRIVKWIFWAIVALGILFFASQNGGRSSSSSSSTYRPAATPSVASAPAQAAGAEVETKPFAGTGGTYSRANVRYCQFESARMDAIDAMITAESNRVISLFNQAVADYNSRCANYQYYQGDQTAVQQEIAVSRAKISADARATLQRWRMSN